MYIEVVVEQKFRHAKSTQEGKKAFFCKLYMLPEFPAKVDRASFKKQGLELVNLLATARSCSPSSMTAMATSSDELRLIALVFGEISPLLIELSTQDIDTNFVLGEKLQELREIVERIVRLNSGRNRGRRG
jgi:hypothetical protein